MITAGSYVRAALSIAMCATIYLCGRADGRAAGELLVARMERDTAQLAEGYAATAANRLIAAKLRGDILERRLAAGEAARSSQSTEHQREILRLTHGVPCLDSRTVRLLNASRGIEPVTYPGTTGRTDAADAAAATDTDVSIWIDAAVRQYDECRERLDALIDWNEAAHD